jgi:hypothetical protein
VAAQISRLSQRFGVLSRDRYFSDVTLRCCRENPGARVPVPFQCLRRREWRESHLWTRTECSPPADRRSPRRKSVYRSIAIIPLVADDRPRAIDSRCRCAANSNVEFISPYRIRPTPATSAAVSPELEPARRRCGDMSERSLRVTKADSPKSFRAASRALRPTDLLARVAGANPKYSKGDCKYDNDESHSTNLSGHKLISSYRGNHTREFARVDAGGCLCRLQPAM